MKQVRRFSSVLLIVCLLLSFATHVRAETLEEGIPQLIHSEFVMWDSIVMGRYNCYAFAIEKSVWCEPGWPSRGEYNPCEDVYAMADLVRADLQSEGNDCIWQQTVRPTSVGSWDNVIAMRKETQRGENNDCHFARLTYAGEWHHKPGNTAVLKFKEAPSNDVAWISEGVTDQGYEREYAVSYDSDIIYMSYKASHGTLVEAWTGNDYHSGNMHYYEFEYTCPDCGEVLETRETSLPCRGPTCVYPWSVEPEHEAS